MVNITANAYTSSYRHYDEQNYRNLPNTVKTEVEHVDAVPLANLRIIAPVERKSLNQEWKEAHECAYAKQNHSIFEQLLCWRWLFFLFFI